MSILEWKLELNLKIKDHSHSWVRISHGLNKLVTDLSRGRRQRARNLWDEVRRICVEDECACFASRSKAKAKPQRRDSASSSRKTIPIGKRIWTDVEPREYSISDYEVSKKPIHLLRHGSLHRENDGAIEFRRIKDNLRNSFFVVIISLTTSGRVQR